ncbi:hypothetical protein P168DRAFT_284606 [Aspergillus campestris IBT 28561]|uniref:Uncharacterized protein n=1 Tax=Aspergillus campestris (strain IBT 28561) TaxID=1392248 RepID=A0A2I1CTV8_ASPC2|nr:uncharacterized protein P168DRAFT_284606 [Aspergillus campestris IBT 28561]PKY01058.1 hypothetical protein P168DRAFT_284606 [Aspergillus campestris IBT 28561]
MTSAPEKAAPNAAERKGHLERLRILERRVYDTENVLYNEAELSDLHISAKPFTLNENGEPTFKPCFFNPFRGNLEEHPYVGELEGDEMEWHSYDETNEISPMGWAQLTFEYWQDYMFAQSFEFKKRTGTDVPAIVCRSTNHYALDLEECNGPVAWLSWGLGHSRDFPKRPHFLCLMTTDIDGENDKLTRGELLCILRMQEKFHTVPFLKQHDIFPVLIISFMGPRHARMLQAHYDGSELIIHKTVLYDFTGDRNVKALSLFSRWAASSGIGSTS